MKGLYHHLLFFCHVEVFLDWGPFGFLSQGVERGSLVSLSIHLSVEAVSSLICKPVETGGLVI